MRLFVALDIENGIKDGLQDAVLDLRRTRAPVRWIKPEGMHLTLKFLGETPEKKLAPLESSLVDACRNIFPFPITVSGLGAFPNLSRPRVLWAGVEEPSGTIEILWRSVETNLGELGWEKEKRKFHPHVTIGRVKGSINLKQLSDAMSEFHGEIWGKQEVTGISLYRSHLEPTGARYEIVRFFPFGG
ncbi:RNA 2',3'-cyclic phosphodiesterase [bacterium]|nr:MAG: RNA 2',3'-cyclic phosphodiesterase [bacterium]